MATEVGGCSKACSRLSSPAAAVFAASFAPVSNLTSTQASQSSYSRFWHFCLPLLSSPNYSHTLAHVAFCSRRRGNRALDRHKQLKSHDYFASSATARRLTLTYSRSATLTDSTSRAVPASIFSSCAIVPGHRAVRASLIGFLVLLDSDSTRTSSLPGFTL
jgi:hypothetical protein